MMKNSIPILLVMLSLFLFSSLAFADVLPPPTSHYVARCVYVSNLEQYPSIVVITQDLNMAGDAQTLSVVQSGQCLHSTDYKFDSYKIYWTSKSYVNSINLNDLKLKNASYDSSSIDDANLHFITSSISPNGYYVDNSMPATREEVFYTLKADSAGQYGLVEEGAAGATNGTENGTVQPGPTTPSAPSKPAGPTPSPPGPSAPESTSYLYMLLVLALGAAAIFILIKSMPHAHPKSMPPANEEPANPMPPATPRSSEPSPKHPAASKPAAAARHSTQKKKGNKKA